MPQGILSGGVTTLTGAGSYIVLDFGKEVGGIVSLDFGSRNPTAQTVSLAFSESIQYAGLSSDTSNGNPPGYLLAFVIPGTRYTMPAERLRGGFRYLTIGLQSDGPVTLTGVSLNFTAAPAMSDLRAYQGSFSSSDDLLDRIWYAGAYTVQMDTIAPNQGQAYPPPPSGWLNNGLSGAGVSLLTDGAKRDRFVWPGDLGIAAPADFVSLGDTLSVRNDLDTLFAMQSEAGCLPYVGPEASLGYVSDTYHLWTLVAVAEYYLYSGDKDWVVLHWPQIKKAVAFSMAKIDTNGLFDISLPSDWGRDVTGGEEISANALLFRVLIETSYLAAVVSDPQAESAYAAAAASLKSSINAQLWDQNAGMYMDKPGSTLYPQDGNSLAVWFGVADTNAKCLSISSALKQRWNRFGAVTPERTNAIASFPGSIEVMAHFAAGDDATALELIRLQWGYMLNSPLGTGSTFWEGLLQDGSFDYGGRYMSLAHGWATGPTYALTLYAAGIGPELSGTTPFHVIPHPGDLTYASATLVLPQGTVSSSWRRLQNGMFIEEVSAPAGIAGRYGIPIPQGSASLSVDRQLVWSTCGSAQIAASALSLGGITSDGKYVYLGSVKGSHTMTAYSGCSE